MVRGGRDHTLTLSSRIQKTHSCQTPGGGAPCTSSSSCSPWSTRVTALCRRSGRRRDSSSGWPTARPTPRLEGGGGGGVSSGDGERAKGGKGTSHRKTTRRSFGGARTSYWRRWDRTNGVRSCPARGGSGSSASTVSFAPWGRRAEPLRGDLS